MKVKIYIEGGGMKSAALDTQFREGWRGFFQKSGLARSPAVIRGGSREQTFKAFQIAVRTRKTGELPLLLVDGESPCDSSISAWRHLRNQDKWLHPENSGDDDAHLMATCMETWLVADRQALKQFFHPNWNDNTIPQWRDLEAVPAKDIQAVLKGATKDRGGKKYEKGRLSFELLGKIDPLQVAEQCPRAKALLKRLREVLSG